MSYISHYSKKCIQVIDMFLFVFFDWYALEFHAIKKDEHILMSIDSKKSG
jgi:hypothetical protein